MALLFAGAAAWAQPAATGVPRAAAATLAPPALARDVLLDDLDRPWDVAPTPDGALLFTQRSGGLYVRRADGSVGLLLRPDDLLARGQSGANGVTLDPDFQRNRRIYFFFASRLGGDAASGSGGPDNRVVRLTVDPGYAGVADRTDIVTGIPFKDGGRAGDPGGSGAHSGGRIRFGPDGFLYVTTGDNHRGLVPQDPRSLGGKVLRVDTDGRPAPGNRAPAGGDPRIFALGFRNPQGLDFHPVSGAPVIAEHGPNHSDEVTVLRNGGNGGWNPVCTNGRNYCGYTSNQADGSLTPMTDTRRMPDALPPAFTTGARSHGMSGATFLRGAQWGAWDGALAVAYLSGTRVDLLKLDADGTLQARTTVLDDGTRIRTLRMAGDGTLLVTTDNRFGGDQIWRVRPVQ